MQRRKYILAAISGISTVGIAGCSGEETQTSGGGTVTTQTGTTKQSVVLLNHEYKVVEEYESDAVSDEYAVVGTGENQSDRPLNVGINWRFYNSDDVQIEDYFTSADSVQPDTKFNFEAPFLGDDPDAVARYEYDFDLSEPV